MLPRHLFCKRWAGIGWTETNNTRAFTTCPPYYVTGEGSDGGDKNPPTEEELMEAAIEA